MVIYVSKNHHDITQIAGKSFCEYPRNHKFLRCLYIYNIYIHHAKLMSLPHFQTDPNIILSAAYLREYQVSISPLLVESWETDQYPINPKKRLKSHYIPLFRNKVIQPNMLLVMCIYLSCLSILSIYLSICLSIYLSACLSIYLFRLSPRRSGSTYQRWRGTGRPWPPRGHPAWCTREGRWAHVLRGASSKNQRFLPWETGG